MVFKDVGGIDGHTFAWIFRVVVRELGRGGGAHFCFCYILFFRMVIEEGSAVAVLQRGTTVVACQNTTWFKDTVYNAGCETYFYLE